MRSPILFSLPKSALQASKFNRPLLYKTSKMSTGIPSQAPVSTAAADSITENHAGGSGTGVSASDLGIENTNISTAAGVNLSERQRVVVGSVLDLFAGRPSLKKLSLWSDTATFADPLTIAEGRKQYSAQWYGLQAAFSSIERLKHEVVSAGNPIEMNLSTKYTVKGIGKEQRIDSVVRIWTEREGGEGSIMKVEDRWNGEIPEGAIAKAFRNLNSVVVPAFVSVPKNEEEDAKKGN
ncbi:proteophosphoglycan ppg4 protein [Rutstroemia sp. NJR-2017a WRK4]|nr:proteophosphoglycan ppg4 protein [Rutstroemia sp. NJR-2017a WRK4]